MERETPPDLRGRVVVVTGGAGFLGMHLVRTLLEEEPELKELRVLDLEGPKELQHPDPRVQWLRGDVGDAEAVGRALRGADVVFHCAGKVGVGEGTPPGELGRVNVQGVRSRPPTPFAIPTPMGAAKPKRKGGCWRGTGWRFLGGGPLCPCPCAPQGSMGRGIPSWHGSTGRAKPGGGCPTPCPPTQSTDGCMWEMSPGSTSLPPVLLCPARSCWGGKFFSVLIFPLSSLTTFSTSGSWGCPWGVTSCPVSSSSSGPTSTPSSPVSSPTTAPSSPLAPWPSLLPPSPSAAPRPKGSWDIGPGIPGKRPGKEPGSGAGAWFERNTPETPRKCPETPQKYPEKNGNPKKYPEIPRKYAETPQKYPETPGNMQKYMEIHGNTLEIHGNITEMRGNILETPRNTRRYSGNSPELRRNTWRHPKIPGNTPEICRNT
ncbi:3 beta-hydroxysteroid dehydrogenase type 7 isoform X1 [Heliangelus exortis]|uniref:3 beta-hydroxysteroid dehydrogenase type 7 isoform X1 n=1 Tax=Heliangelus exortis TaxID=472823 RepID=UPI003A956661